MCVLSFIRHSMSLRHRSRRALRPVLTFQIHPRGQHALQATALTFLNIL